MVKLSDMTLRRGERGLIVGGTGCGKSTLAEYLINDFIDRYRLGQVLILDSKPRFRAEYHANGMPAKRLYKDMDHGPAMPGSVRVTHPDELDLALKLGSRVMIAQDKDLRGGLDVDVGMLTAIAGRFFATSRTSKPRLAVVDETLDFYNPTGQAVRGTQGSLLRIARAGRERGVGGLYLSQRVVGIPTQLRSELAKLYLFRMDHEGDIKHLRDAGAPPEIMDDTPTEDHRFRYWTKQDRARVYGPYRLNI